jgi:hypothetical protein
MDEDETIEKQIIRTAAETNDKKKQDNEKTFSNL